MLGGIMGYANAHAFGLDEPGWRTDPFARPGMSSTDPCAYALSQWLSGCEWTQANYLQLHLRVGQAAAFRQTMTGAGGSASFVLPSAAVAVGRPAAPSADGKALTAALEKRMDEGMMKLRQPQDAGASADGATDKASKSAVRAYAEALRAYHQNPELSKRIALPESLLKAYSGRSATIPPPAPGQKAMELPSYAADATSDWAHPSHTRAGAGREPEAMNAEGCYQRMNHWLNECVLTPM